MAGGSRFRAWDTGAGPIEVTLHLPGRHNVLNALAAMTATGRTGVPLAGAGQSEVTIPITGTLDRPRIDTAALKTTALQDVLRAAPSNEIIRKGIEDGTKEVIRGIDNGLDRLINPRNR